MPPAARPPRETANPDAESVHVRRKRG